MTTKIKNFFRDKTNQKYLLCGLGAIGFVSLTGTVVALTTMKKAEIKEIQKADNDYKEFTDKIIKLEIPTSLKSIIPAELKSEGKEKAPNLKDLIKEKLLAEITRTEKLLEQEKTKVETYDENTKKKYELVVKTVKYTKDLVTNFNNKDEIIGSNSTKDTELFTTELKKLLQGEKSVEYLSRAILLKPWNEFRKKVFEAISELDKKIKANISDDISKEDREKAIKDLQKILNNSGSTPLNFDKFVYEVNEVFEIVKIEKLRELNLLEKFVSGLQFRKYLKYKIAQNDNVKGTVKKYEEFTTAMLEFEEKIEKSENTLNEESILVNFVKTWVEMYQNFEKLSKKVKDFNNLFEQQKDVKYGSSYSFEAALPISLEVIDAVSYTLGEYQEDPKVSEENTTKSE